VNICKCEILCILLASSSLFSQSITGSFFLSGGNTSSNQSYACYSILGETAVGSGSNEAYHVFSGSQFVKDYVLTSIDRFENSSLPSRFSLSQNYPNPFNPSTTIRYDLPKSASVTLRIFNMFGQEIAVLVNQTKEAGYHQVRWDAALPSGVYFYHIQAGDYVETRKMMLLK